MASKMRKRSLSLAISALLSGALLSQDARGATWKLEAETAGDGDVEIREPSSDKTIKSWLITPDAQASGGKVLTGKTSGESRPIATGIPAAGVYRVWVKYQKTPGYASGLGILARDELGAAINFKHLDPAITRTPSERPYQDKPVPPIRGKKDPATLIWESFDATFERPGTINVSLYSIHGDAYMFPVVDCLVISNDTGFDPSQADLAKLPDSAPASPAPAATPGWKPAQGFTMHTLFFSGVDNVHDQFLLSLINQPVFQDMSRVMQMGTNREHGWNAGNKDQGMYTLSGTQHAYSLRPRALATKVPSPEGRFVTGGGQVSSAFSYSYLPYREAMLEEIRDDMPILSQMENFERWRIADENGGRMDYGPASKTRFREWLAARYGTLDKLNSLWHKQYKSFDEIEPPILEVDLRGVRAERKPGDTPKTQTLAPEDLACYFAFREFNGLEYVTTVAESWAVAKALDPKKRGATTQASNIPLLAPAFTVKASLDWEDMINVGLKDVDEVGWDGYAVDDFQGADVDLLASLAAGRRLVNQEWNTHAQQPRITARSFWTMIGKGVRGVHCYQYQNHVRHWSSPMWGLTDAKLQPRPKLGALSDQFHEIHRLERLLTSSTRKNTVKPVALYYSRLDLSLPQFSFTPYDGAVNSPHRVYAMLRSAGYPVTWVTPKQIQAGALENVSAVVMVGVKFVPREAASKIEAWVKQGGVIIGDGWPGALDEHGQPQKTLADSFGVRAAPPPKMTKDAQLAFEEATALSYGTDVTTALTNQGADLFKNINEMFEQWDSTHPVGKKMGHWHLSGYDAKRVQCVSGQVIGQIYNALPGVVLNQHGKGHAMYFAMMLGCSFEGSPTQFEWENMRSGDAMTRLLDEFLIYAGVPKYAATDLPTPIDRKLRIESPLVDAKGNALVGLISMNDVPVGPFEMTLAWPQTMPAPRQALVVTGSSRAITITQITRQGDTLRVRMPGFDSHAMLALLADSTPLIGMDVTGVPRGQAGLLELTPAGTLSISATVYNPSARALAPGQVNLFAAPGWLCDQVSAAAPAIPAWGSAKVSFKVKPPEACANRQLKPVILKYVAGDVTSTPASEVVWWQPQEAPTPAP